MNSPATACAYLAEETKPRIDPTMVARFDSHNDLADLMLDIRDAVDTAGDEKARGVILRRLRRALQRRATAAASRTAAAPVSGPSRRSRGWEE